MPVISQDYMSTRRPSQDQSSQNLDTMSLIYDQLYKMSYLNDADFTSSTSPSPSSISPHDNPELNPDFNYLLKGEPNMSLSPIISQEAALVRPDCQNFESNVRPTVKSELSELYLEYLSPSSISSQDISLN